MTAFQIITTEGGPGSDHSGLTGPAEIPDPPGTRADGADGADRPPERTGVLARLTRAASRTTASVTGLPRVFRLAWAASPGLTLGLLVTTLVTGLVPAASAAIVRLVVDTVVASIRGNPIVNLPLTRLIHHPAVTPAQAIVILVVAQLLVNTMSAFATSSSEACKNLLQEKMTLLIQAKVMAQAGRLDLAFFEEPSSYDLLRQTEDETPLRSLTMLTNACGLVQTAVTFGSMIGLLVALNPYLALLTLLAPIPAFFSDTKYGRAAYLVSMLTSPMRRRMAYLNELAATDIYAKEVKLYGLVPYLIERHRLLGNVFYARQRRLVTRRLTASMAWNSISTMAAAFTYGYVAFAAVSGRLSLGDMTLYVTAATVVQASAQGLFQGLGSMYENNLYLDILERLLAAPRKITAPAHPQPVPEPLRGDLVLEHVSFSYPGSDERVLDDVNLHIPPGETLAVVGRNGAGKSTLIKLLCRLYDPGEGRILLDGIDLRAFDPDELRSRIGILFQDHLTFQATAGENIGIGDVDHIEDLPRIESAAAKAGAAELIASLPKQYATALGKWFDHGSNLSGGEGQKIALSRAFMRDAQILILDEPSAALDAQAEHDLFTRFGRLTEGHTAIYISHRLSIVRRADLIVVLEGGKVAEYGTHDELISVNGVYAELYELQASGYRSGTPTLGGQRD